MTDPATFPRATELAQRSAEHLTVLLGALRTLETGDPRLTPVVRDAILASAYRNATELGSLVEAILHGPSSE